MQFGPHTTMSCARATSVSRVWSVGSSSGSDQALAKMTAAGIPQAPASSSEGSSRELGTARSAQSGPSGSSGAIRSRADRRGSDSAD